MMEPERVSTESPTPQKRSTGPLLFGAMTAAAIAILAVMVMTVEAVLWRAAEREADCQRVVDGREDLRSIWLELFDMFPDSEQGQALHVTLDRRLPLLVCKGATPIAVEVRP